MDPERVPPLPQSEITSPVHALEKGTSGNILSDPFNPSQTNVPRTTARNETGNWIPYAGNVLRESPIPENLEVSKIPSLQHINDYFAQPIQSPLPVRLHESNLEKRETGIMNERFSNTMAPINSGIDWIVPTEEGVSNHLNTLNCFTYYNTRGFENVQLENVCNLPSILLSLRKTNTPLKPSGRDLP